MTLHVERTYRGPVTLNRGGWHLERGGRTTSERLVGARRNWNLAEHGSVEQEHDPEIRTDLVERVRREIAAGTYETPEKLEAAVERLLGYLGQG